MGELQSHEEVVGTPEPLGMGGYQPGPEPRKVVHGVRTHAQLVGVGTTVGTDRHGLATPDQLGAAGSEPFPTSADQVGRTTVARGVPALHGQHGEPVSNRTRHPVGQPYVERPGQGSENKKSI